MIMQFLAARGAIPPPMGTFLYHADQIHHIGPHPTPPVANIPIAMARHHVIAWNILRDAWNKAEQAGKDYICEKIYRVMTDQNSIPSHAAEATVRNNVCWSTYNLILGPEGAIRLFDPGEELDFEAPVAMAGSSKKRVVLLVRLGSLLKKYASVDGDDTKVWKTEFNNIADTIIRTNGDIYQFDRNAWSLYSNAVANWAMTPVGPNVINITQGYWHRAGYSGSCVKKIFGEADSREVGLGNMSALEKKKLLDDVRKNYAKSLNSEHKWKFWNLAP